MGSKLQKSRQAASQLFKTANPDDEFFLIHFNDRPELIVPFTTNTEEIQNRLTFTQAKGRTALLDGVYLAMNQMKKAHNPRKAIIILSDGGDNSSRYTESEIRNAVREADVQIYAIGIFEPIGGRGRTAEEMAGPGLLNELAESTGGRHFPVENINELPDVAAKIGIELRNQYVLGYTPKNETKDGKYRKVQVKLKQPRGLPPLKAFYRLGYYAPTQVPCTLPTPKNYTPCPASNSSPRLASGPVALARGSRDFCPGCHACRCLESQTDGGGTTFHADTRLVVLYASVIDKSGHLVTSLPRSAFKVYENNVEQPIRTFRREDVPVSLGLVIDNSGSMRGKRKSVEAAALAAVKASNSRDEEVVVNFNDEAYDDSNGFTSDLKKLDEALTKIDSRGGTAMRDALNMTIDFVKKKGKHDKKVVLVITDGNDTASTQVTLETLVQKAHDSEVLLYFIGLLNEEDKGEAKKAKRAMEALAKASGAAPFFRIHSRKSSAWPSQWLRNSGINTSSRTRRPFNPSMGHFGRFAWSPMVRTAQLCARAVDITPRPTPDEKTLLNPRPPAASVPDAALSVEGRPRLPPRTLAQSVSPLAH